MGFYCCKAEHEEINELDIYNYGVTYPCIKQEPIFQTRPPCMYGHRCECPCHRGHTCLFKLKSK